MIAKLAAPATGHDAVDDDGRSVSLQGRQRFTERSFGWSKLGIVGGHWR
ncbi:MAG: hypothetical protein ACREQM_07700 [Candidatus Dormibacteraceae bacterium]